MGYNDEVENIRYEGVKSKDGKFYFLDKTTNIIYLDYDGKKKVGYWDESKKMPKYDINEDDENEDIEL